MAARPRHAGWAASVSDSETSFAERRVRAEITWTGADEREVRPREILRLVGA